MPNHMTAGKVITSHFSRVDSVQEAKKNMGQIVAQNYKLYKVEEIVDTRMPFDANSTYILVEGQQQ